MFTNILKFGTNVYLTKLTQLMSWEREVDEREKESDLPKRRDHIEIVKYLGINIRLSFKKLQLKPFVFISLMN